MSKDTGGAAFPGLHPSAECRYAEEGITLHDYFAAKAMEAIISCKDTDFDTYELRAEFAYRQADAMLKERTK